MSEEQPAATRVCRRCSAQSATPGDFCPQCGLSFARRSRRPTRRQWVVGAVLATVVVAAAGGVVAVRHQQAEQTAAAELAEQREADDRERVAAVEQAAADDAERETRASTVTALEDEITKDAKEMVDDDLLDGPILYSQCTATGGGSTDDLTALTGTFDCMAVTTENDDGTIEGYAFSGTADWDAGSIGWHFGR